MQIISHRGYWKEESEKNSLIAFERSFSLNFGTETDIRDFDGKLVISHDVPTKNAILAEEFFKTYKQNNINSTLALNIKSDGIRKLLKPLLEKYAIKNYFVFDMSVPEQIWYIKEGFNTFTRQSEYEKKPVLYEKSVGVWMDSFEKEWRTEEKISFHLNNNKFVCLVSPDLHKRDHKSFWKKLSNMKIIENNNLILCTDIPEEARRLFDGKNKSNNF